MQKKRIMVIGEKETFLVKVLVQKINESGMTGVFEPFDVNAIGMDWEGKDSVMSVVSLKPEGYLLKTIDKRELLDKLEEFFIMSR
ncbi:hypothetical protein [Butyrivibrio sp. INlla21]|uniref:hypothetical protein n=1 Tax=Butyrivibrio sp. INlla21 TaxID=1520811 RepID=UPI0008DEEAB9|nr:hypothetical protein [Butyrivibrio sp. INlla21]SFU49663.1 hypothetical protein SAMN02910342_00718 [Butyrivibrio sp. INlla21]